MASQTPRRSTRIASAAGSAVSVRTNATNRTVGGSRARVSTGHLPRLNVQTSTAYGASGDPVFISNNQSATIGGDLASIFDRQRATALEREGSDAVGGRSRPPSTSSSSRHSSEEAPPEIEQPPPPGPKGMPPPSLRSRQRAVLNNSARVPVVRRITTTTGTFASEVGIEKSFSNYRENGIIRAAEPIQPATRASSRPPYRSPTQRVKLLFKKTPLSTLIYYTLPILFVFFATLISLGYYPDGISVSSLIPRIPSFSQSRHVPEDVATYYYDDLTPRVDSLERRFDRFEAMHKQFQLDLQHLQDRLPNLIALNYDERTNEYEIPNELWTAIQSKLGNVNRKNDLSPSDQETWDTWFKKNQQYVQAMLDRNYDSNLDSKVNAALADKRYVSQDTLLSILDEKYLKSSSEISSTVLSDIRKELARVNRDAKTVALSAVSDQFKSLPLRQLEALAQANLLRNADLALKRINFFSPSYGPYILPRYTSQTMTKSQSWAARAYLSLMWIPGPHPPIAALEPWQEPADCWCAAPSDAREYGSAQLGVHMRHRVYPASLTVEHYPKAGIIDVSSAPKDLELWVLIEDAEQRERVREARSAVFGAADECGAPGKGHRGMVCVGRWRYDVDGPNHVQNFEVDVSMRDMGVAVQRVVVRVTENYGKEWTCLYRVLLHGDLEV